MSLPGLACRFQFVPCFACWGGYTLQHCTLADFVNVYSFLEQLVERRTCTDTEKQSRTPALLLVVLETKALHPGQNLVRCAGFPMPILREASSRPDAHLRPGYPRRAARSEWVGFPHRRRSKHGLGYGEGNGGLAGGGRLLGRAFRVQHARGARECRCRSSNAKRKTISSHLRLRAALFCSLVVQKGFLFHHLIVRRIVVRRNRSFAFCLVHLS